MFFRPARGVVHRHYRESRELESETASLRAAGPSRKTSGNAGTGGRAEGIPRRARLGGGVDARRAGVGRFFFGEEKSLRDTYGVRGADGWRASNADRLESIVFTLVVLRQGPKTSR